MAVLGLLPRGSAAHVFEEDALDFLAEKRPGLDLLGLCEAEVDLAFTHDGVRCRMRIPEHQLSDAR